MPQQTVHYKRKFLTYSGFNFIIIIIIIYHMENKWEGKERQGSWTALSSGDKPSRLRGYYTVVLVQQNWDFLPELGE